MERQAFLQRQFETLRDEIKATKSRLFWIVALGLFGIPLLTKVADLVSEQGTGKFVTLMIPYLVLVLLTMWLAEQNALMRAGRYIRLKIEPNIEDAQGWESWLESRADLRLMDRYFFACFTLVFFLYYFMSIGFALQPIYAAQALDPAESYWLYGALVTYLLGALWGLSTLIHHWRSCVGTTDDQE